MNRGSRTERGSPGSREGFLTVLVLLILLVGLTAAGALHGLTRQAHRRTSDQALRTMARTLAEAALEEAHAVTSRLVNDPDGFPVEGAGRLFDRFRVWGDRGSGEDLTTAGFRFRPPLRHTHELLATAAYETHRFEIDVTTDVPAQVSILRANDRAGTLVHRVEVRSGSVREVVERQYGFRVSLVTAMRPYERVTLMIEDAREFFRAPRPDEPGLAELAGNLTDAWLRSARVRLEVVARIRAGLVAGDPDSPDPGALTRLETIPDEPLDFSRALAEQTRRLEDQGYLLAVHPLADASSGAGARLDLEQLDWSRASGRELDAAMAALVRLHTALEVLDRAAPGEPDRRDAGDPDRPRGPVTTTRSGPDGIARGREALEERDGGRSAGHDLRRLSRDAARAAGDFERAFSEAVDSLTRTAGAFRAFSPAESRIRDALERTFELLQPEAWIARTYQRVRPSDPRHGDGTFAGFLRRRSHPGRPVNGIILWDDPDHPLEINDLTFSGKLIVVATGDVRIAGVRKAGPDSLLTVAAMGRLQVRGHVEASLVALGDVETDVTTRISGNLVLRRFAPGLAGAVELDPYLTAGRGPSVPATESGAARRHYYVAITPGPLATRVGT